MNKQSILGRMLRFAANFLSVKRIEQLDPVIILFVESLAEEIYKLSSEIGNIESRILETLSGILAPDTSLSAQPAHCILHASTEEPEAILSHESPFILKEKRYFPSAVIDQLIFHPIRNTKIRKGDIRYVIYNGLCYFVDTDQTKTLISRSNNTNFNQRNTYWIALELDEEIVSLKDISFYFDFQGITNKNEYISLLPFTTWKLQNKTITVKQGLHVIEDTTSNETIRLFTHLDIPGKLDEAILDVYDKQFLTITDDINLATEKTPFPKELSNYFPASLSDDFTKPLLWFEIECPLKYQSDIKESITVSINAFPVVNKTLHSKVVEMNNLLQVIPLETANYESFLSIHSIVDSQGRMYYELPFDDTPSQQYMTYSLRRGGYERYNKRDAKEYLSILTNLLEEQSSIGSNNVLADDNKEAVLKQIDDLIMHIKKTLTLTKEKLEVQNYILIDQLSDEEIFFVKYWITNCEQANNIKQNTIFDYIQSDIRINPLSIFNLTETKGGKYTPQSTDKQNLRIKSLSNRSMLVTHEDIIVFCKKEFQNMVTNINISKGITKSPTHQQEFIETLDVFLSFKNDIKHFNNSDSEMFRHLLQSHSPATYNYRVFINND